MSSTLQKYRSVRLFEHEVLTADVLVDRLLVQLADERDDQPAEARPVPVALARDSWYASMSSYRIAEISRSSSTTS